jgi:hypothetical protein
MSRYTSAFFFIAQWFVPDETFRQMGSSAPNNSLHHRNSKKPMHKSIPLISHRIQRSNDTPLL